MVDDGYASAAATIYDLAFTARKKKGEPEFAFFRKLAEWTGLEPATPGVTGRYSNQLNYHSGKSYEAAFAATCKSS